MASICKSADGAETESGMEKPRRLSLPNTLEDIDVIKVIVQICLPNKVVAFKDEGIDLKQISKVRTSVEVLEANGIREHRTDAAPIADSQGDKGVVRRWIVGSAPAELRSSWLPFSYVTNTNGKLRAGGEFVSLFGSTKKNQPVFEAKGRSQKDYIALKTSVEVDKDGQREFLKYWFKLPTSIATGEFSNWQEPISQEDPQVRDKQQNPTAWNLTHGKEMEIYAVGENAPKMRFKLMRIGDYYDENRFWYRSQEAITEKYYKGVVGEERERIHFVPKSRNDIPGC